jgi:hypothetical protein
MYPYPKYAFFIHRIAHKIALIFVTGKIGSGMNFRRIVRINLNGVAHGNS